MANLFNKKYEPEMCLSLIKWMGQGKSYITWGVSSTPYVGKSTMYDWEKEYPEWKAAKETGYALGLLYNENLLEAVKLGFIPKELQEQLGTKKIDLQSVLFTLRTRFYKEYSERHIQVHANDDDEGDGEFVVKFVDPKKQEEPSDTAKAVAKLISPPQQSKSDDSE